MPLSHEPSKDVPFYIRDRSSVAREVQNFEGLFADFAATSARAQTNARIARWLRRIVIAALIAVISAYVALTAWPKTQNTLALYYSIDASRSAG